MGIDIYLNGYEGHESRTAEAHKAFDKAVKDREALPKAMAESTQAKKAQKRVDTAYGALYAGSTGYLRSSYNGSGLFRVLEEIFGFDVAEYFFPGDWDNQGDGIPIDGAEFVKKVENLRETVLLAMKNNHRALPWVEEFTKVTGQRAPDPNPARAKAELFGDSVAAMIKQGALGKMDKIEGGPRDPEAEFNGRHVWYVTHGLQDLYDFGQLAKELNERGEKTFAYISF